ncbi:hypothetical protein U0C82_17950 [Fulvimarina sp. 2208YS6-2-32]|uniref:Uncharacterized protein n=1 Tax=Fulvimarina uroteuthidis TaxID=3098149 RepID=A0ABU5I6J8_9HYPH|nr:hypothetical protein [Fulvimarina sp. 2208YS6-2-32]MDY8111017.1 hypothetical protein [Fulvimarina sp. 2208YS6-2-32]
MGIDNTHNNTGGFGSAIKRTDKRYNGEEVGEELIGKDIPQEVQDWEAMSEDERAAAIKDGKTPPKGAQV